MYTLMFKNFAEETRDIHKNDGHYEITPGQRPSS